MTQKRQHSMDAALFYRESTESRSPGSAPDLVHRGSVWGGDVSVVRAPVNSVACVRASAPSPGSTGPRGPWDSGYQSEKFPLRQRVPVRSFQSETSEESFHSRECRKVSTQTGSFQQPHVSRLHRGTQCVTHPVQTRLASRRKLSNTAVGNTQWA